MLGTHLVTEKVTPVGCCKFNRFIEPTVWPGCSVTFSKINWSVTFKNCLRSFHIWIVLQLQINTVWLTHCKSLIRASQFCWYLWLSRRKHSWWSPNWFTCVRRLEMTTDDHRWSKVTMDNIRMNGDNLMKHVSDFAHSWSKGIFLMKYLIPQHK